MEGVVVGVDQTQEWILPWWHYHYSRHNSHPITFVDFGMTDSMKHWCKARGNFIHLLVHIFAAEKEEVHPNAIAEWETQFGLRVWLSRMAWFKKPFACLKSPYERSLWIDVDCEILSSIAPLFSECDHPSGIAMARDLIVPPLYNSGVIAFKKNIPILHKWAEMCESRNGEFGGDQEVLFSLLKEPIGELAPEWNWSRCSKPNENAKIIHWHGDNGRMIIRHQMEKLCLSE